MIWAVDQSLIVGAGSDRLNPLGQAARAECRLSGDSMVRKWEDSRWEGRIVIG